MGNPWADSLLMLESFAFKTKPVEPTSIPKA